MRLRRFTPRVQGERYGQKFSRRTELCATSICLNHMMVKVCHPESRKDGKPYDISPYPSAARSCGPGMDAPTLHVGDLGRCSKIDAARVGVQFVSRGAP